MFLFFLHLSVFVREMERGMAGVWRLLSLAEEGCSFHSVSEKVGVLHVHS